MRREALYLRDIVEAADAITRFSQDVGQDSFFGNELRQSSVLQKLIVIGEAAVRLPPAFREQHPVVEWRDVVGFRNIAVHSYFSVKWEIV